jgi:hypothetical protein
MNCARVRIGDPVDNECRRVREGHSVRTTIGFRPKDGLPILGEPARREVGNAINAAAGPFQASTLREPSQDGTREAGLTSVGGSEEAVVLLR